MGLDKSGGLYSDTDFEYQKPNTIEKMAKIYHFVLIAIMLFSMVSTSPVPNAGQGESRILNEFGKLIHDLDAAVLSRSQQQAALQPQVLMMNPGMARNSYIAQMMGGNNGLSDYRIF